jgi:hypothetical protein
MCDYSLHAQPNRLAIEGERLVVHRFPGGSLGLTSPSETLGARKTNWADVLRRWSWSGMMNRVELSNAKPKGVCAVCIPPGSRLIVRDIPLNTRVLLRVAETEKVIFEQLSAREFTYRDAIRFDNGATLILQRLNPGQRVDVLSLHSNEGVEEPELRHRIPEYARHARCA